MRALFALAAFLLLAAGPAHNWSHRVGQTAAGAYVRGNPAAPTKLVEYASYTCSHCAAFAVESAPVLQAKMVADGSTSFEVRHIIRDPVDLAAAIVARCGGGPRFFALHAAILTQQSEWLPRAMNFAQINANRIGMYPELDRLKALAEGGGLIAIGEKVGLTAATLDACFADRAAIDRITAITAAANDAGVAGTPAFAINGGKLDYLTWATLEPILRAHGAH